MNPAIIGALAAVSGVFGVIAVIAYLIVYLKIKQLENVKTRSVRDSIEGDPIFNADQVLHILDKFKTDASRLKALRHLAEIQAASQGSADQTYAKIKKNIDIFESQKENYKRVVKSSPLIIGSLFLLSITSVLYGLASSPDFRQDLLSYIKYVFPPKTEIINYLSPPVSITSGTFSDGRNTISQTFCIIAPSGTKFEVATAKIIVASKDGSVDYNISVSTSQKICATASVTRTQAQQRSFGVFVLQASFVRPTGTNLIPILSN